MKHAVLTSIAHNIANSLASGIGLLIGVYDLDVFGEATQSKDGYIEVDFLGGNTTGAQPSKSLLDAIQRYANALPSLCERQGANVADFRRLTAKYSGHSFVVEVTDQRGKTSRDRYVGNPGARPKALDPLGRVRRVRSA